MSVVYNVLFPCFSDNEETGQDQYKELIVRFVSEDYLDECENSSFFNVLG